MSTRTIGTLFVGIFVVLATGQAGCGAGRGGDGTTPQAGAEHGALTRLRFNQLAVRLDLPLFWEADRDQDGVVDPDEVRALRFYPTAGDWVREGAFTPAFEAAYQAMVQAGAAPPPDDPRLRLVVEELENSAPTLVANDLRGLPADHHAFVEHMLRATATIDALYALQVGMTAMAARVPAEPESRSLFRRNWGPSCLSPRTEQEPACSAIPGAPRQPVDAYPAELQATDGFCAALEARPDSAALLTPFTVVRGDAGGALRAVPITEAYAAQMQEVAAELRAAADALADPAEEALRAYLRAAAQSFTTNDWNPADEAWAAMNTRNSRWYLRVGPDEVYWDPCSQKAGFHLTLALVNRDSLAWQDRLTPLQQDLEAALAGLVTSYQARQVAFHMPDFIDIVSNAGDDRDAFGATIGQSLPNWGRVADEGRGRTVVMTNLYTDPDSVERRRERAATMLTAESMQPFVASPEPALIGTILHEAAHNLGPSHEYRVDGRTDDEVFGGGLASLMEELKAQTAALFFIDFLRQRGAITEQQQREAYLDQVIWALGHVSRGMWTASHQRKPYSQLAAIQIGFLMDEGAIRFDPNATAANGTDRGAFAIDFAAMPAAVERLMRQVMEIKSTGDRPRAEALAARYVDGDRVPQALVVERSQRFPAPTMVYAVDL
jgi:hypothetical protein